MSDLTDWTAERIQQLRRLWDEGVPTAEIGVRMRLSKNAVVGKAHRLNLPSRPSPIRKDAPGTPRRQRAPRMRKVPTIPAIPSLAGAPPADAQTPEPKAPRRLARIDPSAAPSQPDPPVAPAAAPELPLSDKPCQWPIGTPGRASFRFCQDRSVVGRPYCPEHCRIAYLPPTKRDQRELESASR